MESCPIFLKRIIEECFWQISNKISEEKHLKQSNRLFLVRKRFSFSANVWFIADNFCGKGCLVWILGCVDEYLWIFSDIFQCVPVTRTHNQFYFPPRPLLTSAVPRPRQKKQNRSVDIFVKNVSELFSVPASIYHCYHLFVSLLVV